MGIKFNFKNWANLRFLLLFLLVIILSEYAVFYFFRKRTYDFFLQDSKNFTFLSSRFIMESYKNNYKKSFLRFLEDISKIVKLNPNLEDVELIDVSGFVIFDSKDILKKYVEENKIIKKMITDRKMLSYTRGIKPVYILNEKEDKLVIFFPYVEEFGNHFYTFRYTFSTEEVYGSLYSILTVLLIFYVLVGLLIYQFYRNMFLKFSNGVSVLNKSIEDLSKGKYTYIKDENEFFKKVFNNFNVLLENYKFILNDEERTVSTLKDLLEKCDEDKEALNYDLKKKNEMLKDVIDDARRVRRERINFLAKISHELRTPLNSILGFTGLLIQGVRGELSEEMRSDLFSIYKNAQFLLKIVDDMLNLSKIEMNKFELDIKKIDIKALLDNIYSDFMPIALEKGLQLDLIVDEVPYVFGDEIKIREVINNLIDNSLKFTENGYIRVKASRYSEKEDMVLIAVEDTGIGIKNDELDRIFEDFYQVDGRKGTGIGLSISKKFVEVMGGEMWAESKFGKGSTFYFTLPIAE